MKKILGIVLLCALVLVGCHNAPQSNGSQYKAVGYSDLAEPTYDATTNKVADGSEEPFPGFKEETIIMPILKGTIPGIWNSLSQFYGGIIKGEDCSISSSKSASASVNLSIRDEAMEMTASELGTGRAGVDYLDARISANTDKLVPAIGQILSSLRPGVASKFEKMEAMSGVNGDLFLNSRLLVDYVDKDGKNGLGLAFSEYVNLHLKDFTVENSKNADDEPVTTVSGKVTSDPIHLTLAGTQIFYELTKDSGKKAYSYCIPWTISLDVAAINLDLSKISETKDTDTGDSESPDASTDPATSPDESSNPSGPGTDEGPSDSDIEAFEANIREIIFGGAKGDFITLHVAFYDAEGNVIKDYPFTNSEVIGLFGMGN